MIQRLPFPDLSQEDSSALRVAATAAVQATRRLFCRDETSHDFIRPTVASEPSVIAVAKSLEAEEADVFDRLIRLRRNLDEIAARAYAFTASDLEEMEREFAERIPPA